MSPLCTHIKGHGGAFSPLLGAFYLQPVDIAMQEMVAKGKIYYIRHMDDMVAFARTRWHLCKAVGVQSLGLVLHKGKRFIGRIDISFDCLGHWIHPFRKLRPSSESLKRFTLRACRLYEQGAGINRFWLYVIRWTGWLWGGLRGLVALKGGYKRYMIYLLKQLRISGYMFPGEWCPAGLGLAGP